MIKLHAILVVISVISILPLTFPMSAAETEQCEQCGMTLDEIGQNRFMIIDTSGDHHYACCPICALRLQRTYNNLNITSFCDYYGPDYPITIIAKNNGTDVTVNPPDALIIAAGSCTKNRIVYNYTAADALLAQPYNGTSKWLSTLFNYTIASNATRLAIAQAALINGVGVNPSSTTTAPPSDAILECEVCGMDVTAESRARYKVTDGNDNSHYVECFMCALELINNYETLRIKTYCDWYGPDYQLTVDSTNYGGIIVVNPTTAIFLRGGSCVTARAAYNQTAAENLLAVGFSQFTSPEQRYALPNNTEFKLVTEAIEVWYAQPNTSSSTTLILVGATAVGIAIFAGSVLAYKKLKFQSKD